MKSNRALGIFYLAIGLVMFILGTSTPSVVDEFKVYWLATACALIPGVLITIGGRLDVTATFFARIVVGSLFVVSGLIKANDTVGFSFKLEEYFDENSLGSFWAMFHDYSLPLAIFVAGVEVVLGLAVLVGGKSGITAWALLAMTIFFGWLTYFTASCNDAQMAAIVAGQEFNQVCVTDCGCFGDALRGSVGRSLTPWESFYKDLALFFLVLILFIRRRKISLNSYKDDLIIFPLALISIGLFGGWLFGWMFPTYFVIAIVILYLIIKATKLDTNKKELLIALAMFVVTYGFALYTYMHLPIKDYRPYAEGKNIKEQMKTAEELGLPPTIYANVYVLKNETTGETMTMNSNEYLEKQIWKDKQWKIESTGSEPIVIQRGYEAPIQSFVIEDNEGFEAGDALLNVRNYMFMLVSYDLEKADKEALEEINMFAINSEEAGYGFFAVSSSSQEYKSEITNKYKLPYSIYTADEIFLKTIIRSNPGLLLLKDGTVIKKWHHNDIPDFAEVHRKYLN